MYGEEEKKANFEVRITKRPTTIHDTASKLVVYEYIIMAYEIQNELSFELCKDGSGIQKNIENP